MEVVYSAQRSGFETGKVYRNPRYFDRPMPAGVQRVVVVGHWPKVVAAYEALGIEVECVGALTAPQANPVTPDDGYPSDIAMRDAIKERTGKAPHWKSTRETLIERYDDADA